MFVNNMLRSDFNKRVNKDFEYILTTPYKNDQMIILFKKKLDKAEFSTYNLVSAALIKCPLIALFEDYIEEFRPQSVEYYQKLFEKC